MSSGLEWEVIWSSARPTVHLLDPQRRETHTLCGIRLRELEEGGPWWESDDLLGATFANHPFLPQHRRDHYEGEDEAVQQRANCQRCLWGHRKLKAG